MANQLSKPTSVDGLREYFVEFWYKAYRSGQRNDDGSELEDVDEVLAKINRLMLEARLAGAIDCATWVMQHDESSFRQERAWFKVKPALFLKYQAELLKELQELSNNLKEGI